MTWPLWLQVLVVLAFMLSPFVLGWCQGVAREQPSATLRSVRAGHATYTEMKPGAAQEILTNPANKITYVDMFPQ